MLLPAVFHENLFDDWFDPFFDDMDRELNRESRQVFGKRRGVEDVATLAGMRKTTGARVAPPTSLNAGSISSESSLGEKKSSTHTFCLASLTRSPRSPLNFLFCKRLERKGVDDSATNLVASDALLTGVEEGMLVTPGSFPWRYSLREAAIRLCRAE